MFVAAAECVLRLWWGVWGWFWDVLGAWVHRRFIYPSSRVRLWEKGGVRLVIFIKNERIRRRYEHEDENEHNIESENEKDNENNE